MWLKYQYVTKQARIFLNLTNWSFLFLVPVLYRTIFKFRIIHTQTIKGIVENKCQFLVLYEYKCKGIDYIFTILHMTSGSFLLAFTRDKRDRETEEEAKQLSFN